MSHDDIVKNGQTQADVASGKISAQEFAEQMDADARKQVISAELNAQIQNFKNIQVHTTTEDFGRENTQVTYDTVVFDATQN